MGHADIMNKTNGHSFRRPERPLDNYAHLFTKHKRYTTCDVIAKPKNKTTFKTAGMSAQAVFQSWLLNRVETWGYIHI